MKIRGLLAIAALASISSILLSTACGGGGSSNSGSNGSGSGGGGGTTNNTAAVTVDAGPVGNASNTAFVTVTICVPGSSSCTNIDHVEVDTGSSGLRILAPLVSALGLPTSTTIGECLQFADMTYLWGPVATADIKISGEVASKVPIQVINAGFQSIPSGCTTAGGTNINDATGLGANGILGVSTFRQDCGQACAFGAPSGTYYDCSSGTCQATSMTLQAQVQNPVSLFAKDNNGVVITLPAISDAGVSNVTGQLFFGIGTQSNNALGTAGMIQLGSDGMFSANFKGTAYNDSSVIDSGSNGFFFLDSQTLGNFGIIMPDCSNDKSFYCPPSITPIQVSVIGQTSSGTPIGSAQQVSFNIMRADQFASTVFAADDIGGDSPSSSGISFDFGLPFFFGKTVFTGFETSTTGNGTGAYVAFRSGS